MQQSYHPGQHAMTPNHPGHHAMQPSPRPLTAAAMPRRGYISASPEVTQQSLLQARPVARPLEHASSTPNAAGPCSRNAGAGSRDQDHRASNRRALTPPQGNTSGSCGHLTPLRAGQMNTASTGSTGHIGDNCDASHRRTTPPQAGSSATCARPTGRPAGQGQVSPRGQGATTTPRLTPRERMDKGANGSRSGTSAKIQPTSPHRSAWGDSYGRGSPSSSVTAPAGRTGIDRESAYDAYSRGSSVTVPAACDGFDASYDAYDAYDAYSRRTPSSFAPVPSGRSGSQRGPTSVGHGHGSPSSSVNAPASRTDGEIGGRVDRGLPSDPYNRRGSPSKCITAHAPRNQRGSPASATRSDSHTVSQDGRGLRTTYPCSRADVDTWSRHGSPSNSSNVPVHRTDASTGSRADYSVSGDGYSRGSPSDSHVGVLTASLADRCCAVGSLARDGHGRSSPSTSRSEALSCSRVDGRSSPSYSRSTPSVAVPASCPDPGFPRSDAASREHSRSGDGTPRGEHGRGGDGTPRGGRPVSSTGCHHTRQGSQQAPRSTLAPVTPRTGSRKAIATSVSANAASTASEVAAMTMSGSHGKPHGNENERPSNHAGKPLTARGSAKKSSHIDQAVQKSIARIANDTGVAIESSSFEPPGSATKLATRIGGGFTGRASVLSAVPDVSLSVCSESTVQEVPDEFGGDYTARSLYLKVPDELGGAMDRPPASILINCGIHRSSSPGQALTSSVLAPQASPIPAEVERARAAALEAQLRRKEVELLEERARSAALESKLASLAFGPDLQKTPLSAREELGKICQEQAEEHARRPYSQPPPRHTAFASPQKGKAIECSPERSSSLPPSPQAWRPPEGTWGGGVFDLKLKGVAMKSPGSKPRQLVLRSLAASLQEGLLGVLQGAPCFTGYDPDQVPKGSPQQWEDRQPRQSLGEVIIADIASPQRQRRRVKAIGSPAQGSNRGVGFPAVAINWNVGEVASTCPTSSPPGSHRKSKSPPSQTRKTGKPSGGRVQATPQVKVQKGDIAPKSARSTPSQGHRRHMGSSPGKGGTAAQQAAEHCGILGSPPSASKQTPVPKQDYYACDFGGGFMDDVKLRADVTRLKKSGKPARCGNSLVREGCEFHEEKGRTHHSLKGSPSSQRISEGSHEGSSPDPDNVTLDFSDILGTSQGCPVLGSEDGRSPGKSLDDSMMGGSVGDDSFAEDGLCVPGLPEPRLCERRNANAPSHSPQPSSPQKVGPPQPKRTVFFPAPPVSAATTVFHAGHYQGWSQRSTTRSLSPNAVLGM